MLERLRHLLSLLSVVAIVGCGPEVSDGELGRVILQTPPIPQGYQPYELPDLTTSPDEASKESGDGPEAASQPSAQAEQAVQASPEPADPPSDPAPPDALAPAAD